MALGLPAPVNSDTTGSTGLSDSEASKKLNLLEEELAGSFPGVNYPASKEK